ncbi:uncharacterized protein C1orf21 homolog isoform X1 [Gambusia affinis]|uniref:uncharacterized protein C1orf21 homolog isoform X1 n=1 Tax=Gambusia affinis TaxID=33528 RepID=UPI001CDD7C9C|nr:uncharacterized protein C1orf21 homolog isoform X1 [Gambusia affinis]XP_043984599.1 uncharacterized protein C1orf21 homolog isoform X1 [Gambusia affinis]XP_043984600.1 uncharacterized protein C1orf21 homolog isoform X1 [Gambusia affinis]XP_043984601.1 uncharacterized protein C1orf21 homolog isoform X1 [Gambusia affinis]
MGCTSAKQVSAVPNDEEGRGKAYSNGDLYSDEYKMKGVEEVKYMRGDENRVNARNQENLEKSNVEYRGKQQKEAAATNIKSNIHTSESQQEFFRMLDEKIEKISRHKRLFFIGFQSWILGVRLPREKIDYVPGEALFPPFFLDHCPPKTIQ